MSINVDDTGTPYPGDDDRIVPLDELRALSWMEIRARYEDRYPDLGAYLNDLPIPDALAAHSDAVHIPRAYLHVLRDGTPDGTYTISVGGQPVRVAVAADRRRCKHDPARERDSWQQLRDIVATTTCAGIVLDLPQELVLAVWERDGHEVWACRPGTPTGIMRKARQRRRRLTALSPLPLLGAFGQAVTSGTCAASFAFAPVLPSMPLPDSDHGVYSRPPAVAAHPQAQAPLPRPGEVVRTDVFLPPVASPDYVRPESAPASPAASPAPVVSSSPAASPPSAEPSPSPSPTGGDATPSPAPNPEETVEQAVSEAPANPEKSKTPAPGTVEGSARPQPRRPEASERTGHPRRHGHRHGHNSGHR